MFFNLKLIPLLPFAGAANFGAPAREPESSPSDFH